MINPENFTSKGLLYLIVSFSILLNCTEKNNQNTIPTFHIDPNMNSLESNLSNLASEVKVVPLETNMECLIGGLSHLEYLDSEYIIYKTDKTLLIFNGAGKFLNKIDAEGDGPEEYQSIQSTFVDAQNGLIYIADHRKVMVFNMEGEFTKSFKVSFPVAGLCKINEVQFLVPVSQIYSEKNRDMLYIMDSTFQIIQSFKSKNPDEISDIRQRFHYAGDPYEIDNKFYYKEPFVDTIYEVMASGLKPSLKIDLNGKGFSTREAISVENYRQASKNKIPPMGIRESDKLIFFDYYYVNAKYLSIYDKASQKNIFHKKFLLTNLEDNRLNLGINNDLVKGAPSFLPKYVKGNVMVSVVDPGNLTKDQIKLFNVKKEDNPILFLATIKD